MADDNGDHIFVPIAARFTEREKLAFFFDCSLCALSCLYVCMCARACACMCAIVCVCDCVCVCTHVCIALFLSIVGSNQLIRNSDFKEVYLKGTVNSLLMPFVIDCTE